MEGIQEEISRIRRHKRESVVWNGIKDGTWAKEKDNTECTSRSIAEERDNKHGTGMHSDSADGSVGLAGGGEENVLPHVLKGTGTVTGATSVPSAI